MLDQALVLWLPGPASFTGEDIAELHLHGSPAVLAAVLAELGRMPGCRLAEPGEFTRRAFDHGKLDLTEIEGLADLLAAETEAQRRQAVRQMEGALGRLYDGWRDRLVRALAHFEATIDFAEEDIPADLTDRVLVECATLAAEMRRHLADGGRGERLRAGLEVAILGAPNVGKSSLLNALAGRERAIVSPVAGTTRDVIEVSLDIAGWPITLADTAGLRAAADVIEQEGIRRALDRATRADLVLLVMDARDWPSVPVAPTDVRTLLVANKADLAPPLPDRILAVSCLQGLGLDILAARLAEEAGQAMDSGDALMTRVRYREAVEAALSALDRVADAPELALAAEDIRLAVRALGRITGRVDVEDLLDIVFRDFCIGK